MAVCEATNKWIDKKPLLENKVEMRKWKRQQPFKDIVPHTAHMSVGHFTIETIACRRLNP